MEIITELFSHAVIRFTLIVVLSIASLMLVVFFIQYNVDRIKGRHAKFLWFETKPVEQVVMAGIQVAPAAEIHNSKNVNTGSNWGSIGDTYTGISQRHLEGDDVTALVAQIESFRMEHRDKIRHAHITVGQPGDKESTILANEIAAALIARGYSIVPAVLMTYGVTGKNWGVSNAPDDSVMVEVYPADNV